MTIHVVFVCLGNICRSPSAQGVFERLVSTAGLAHAISADSCGTAAFNVGKNPDPRAITACEQHGYDIRDQVARQIHDSDYETAHYILGMDAMNLRNIRSWAPTGYGGELELLKHYSAINRKAEIPDPYYGDDQQFTRVIGVIEEACQGLLDHIIRQHGLDESRQD